PSRDPPGVGLRAPERRPDLLAPLRRGPRARAEGDDRALDAGSADRRGAALARRHLRLFGRERAARERRPRQQQRRPPAGALRRARRAPRRDPGARRRRSLAPRPSRRPRRSAGVLERGRTGDPPRRRRPFDDPEPRSGRGDGDRGRRGAGAPLAASGGGGRSAGGPHRAPPRAGGGPSSGLLADRPGRALALADRPLAPRRAPPGDVGVGGHPRRPAELGAGDRAGGAPAGGPRARGRLPGCADPGRPRVTPSLSLYAHLPTRRPEHRASPRAATRPRGRGALAPSAPAEPSPGG